MIERRRCVPHRSLWPNNHGLRAGLSLLARGQGRHVSCCREGGTAPHPRLGQPLRWQQSHHLPEGRVASKARQGRRPQHRSLNAHHACDHGRRPQQDERTTGGITDITFIGSQTSATRDRVTPRQQTQLSHGQRCDGDATIGATTLDRAGHPHLQGRTRARHC